MPASQLAGGDDFPGGESNDAWPPPGAGPSNSGGAPLNDLGYPDWSFGDLANGLGLLGSVPPADHADVAQAARAAVSRYVNQGIAQSLNLGPIVPRPGQSATQSPQSAKVAPVQPAAAGDPFWSNFGSGYVNDFNGLYGDVVRAGQNLIGDPIGSVQHVVSLATPLGQAQAAVRVGQQEISNGIDLARGYQAASRSGTLPAFYGDLAGHGAAKLTQAAVAGAIGGGAGLLLRGAAEAAPLDAAAWTPKIPKIRGRPPINSRYAGQTHPSGIDFSSQGFPIFGPHAKTEVRISGLRGIYKKDAARANEMAGLNKTPPGHVWHHVEDMKTMQLLPKRVHESVGHTGGIAVIRNGGFDR